MHFGFVLACGLGNRLNNLISMMYVQVHIARQNVMYYFDSRNSHFDCDTQDIIDIEALGHAFGVKLVRCVSRTELARRLPGAYYASAYTNSPWHDSAHWLKIIKSKKSIICVTFNLFAWADIAWQADILARLRFSAAVEDAFMSCAPYVPYRMCVMHVRRGDLSRAFIDDASLDRALKRVAALAREQPAVLLLTDDAKLRRDIADDVPHITTTQTSLPEYDETRSKVYRSRDVIVWGACELLLMMRGRVAVYSSYSTFSHLGAVPSIARGDAIVDIAAIAQPE